MSLRYQGDRIGKLDERGIAEWYPKCKVRREGSVYIATPHMTNPARKSYRPEQTVCVTQKDGKYELAERPEIPAEEGLEEVPEGENETAERGDEDLKTGDGNTFLTTRRELFNELYEKHTRRKPHERKKAILREMTPLFPTEEAAKNFVDSQWRRVRRNEHVRKLRFKQKAYNQNYEFFFTVTYDDKKHTAESFERSLKNVFANLHKRYGCLVQGMWEYGADSDRLHFHGLMYDPEHKVRETLEIVREYNPQTGRMETFARSKYFLERFGRNSFSEIVPQMYDAAIDYLTKYLSKDGVKPYYSRGLYRYIESDICGDDVLGKMDPTGRDIRLIVAGDFEIWQDGEHIGKPTPENLERATKLA